MYSEYQGCDNEPCWFNTYGFYSAPTTVCAKNHETCSGWSCNDDTYSVNDRCQSKYVCCNFANTEQDCDTPPCWFTAKSCPKAVTNDCPGWTCTSSQVGTLCDDEYWCCDQQSGACSLRNGRTSPCWSADEKCENL